MSRCPICGRQLDEDGACWVPGHSDSEVMTAVLPRVTSTTTVLSPGDRHDACGQEVDITGCCGCKDWGTGMMPTPTPAVIVMATAAIDRGLRRFIPPATALIDGQVVFLN